MKKLIAVVVAMMMAFSCTFALAEEAAQAQTSLIPSFSAVANIQVNEEAVTNLLAAYGADEATAAYIKTFLPLFSDLSEEFVFADNGVQYDLKMKDQNVFSLVAELKENGIELATDLLPSYVLTLQYETITKLMEQFSSQFGESMKELDMELVMKAAENIVNYAMELVPVYQSAVTFGEPVKGEYAGLIEGVVFNTEIPLTVDVKAIITAVKGFVDKLIADESIKAALESVTAMIPGANIDLSQLTMEDVPEEYIPEVSGLVYTITDDEGNQTAPNTFVIVNAVGKNDDSGNTTTYVYVAENSVDVTVEVPAQQLSFECYVETLEDGFTVNYAISAPGLDMEIACAVTTGEEGIGLAVALYMNDIEQPVLTATIGFAMGGERTKTVADSGKPMLGLDGLLAEEPSMEVAGALMLDLMTGVSTVVGNIKAVEPVAGAVLEELVNQVMSLFVSTAEEMPAA
ncbi:MAG: hypothetical protein IKH57_16465 [Clostridia bacterium]|nr:hypothetical protein [Clostridia bacterium]